MKARFLLLLCFALPLMAQTKKTSAPVFPQTKDIHSFSNPRDVMVTHVDLDLSVNFEKKMLDGVATLKFTRSKTGGSAPLILDTRDLTIRKVETGSGTKFADAKFEQGKFVEFLGQPLTIQLPAGADRVRISYATSPQAVALQWLTPEMTVGKKHPYLMTQSESTFARTWIPLQDSPGVRVTYTAKIHTPKGLVALMSAQGNPQPKASLTSQANPQTEFTFHQPIAIPSYLIALAVGDIVFRPIGARSGVYDEPSVVDRDAKEFEDLPKMITAAEKLYGPYAWGRYDVLVLPASFPYGGMENPSLTFATPTIIAGDKSLVNVIAHELAHSWSGNTVTNATWSDFWLNEGFTTYAERRIQEQVFGKKRADMEAILGRQTLDKLTKEYEPRDQVLHVNLEGRDADDGSTEIPYEKGSLFLRHLEETFGRATFDTFLRGYLAHFRFQSISTQQFTDYLKTNLLNGNPELAAKVPVQEWIYEPGVPKSAPVVQSDAFEKVEAQAKKFVDGAKPGELATKDYSTQEWLHFIQALPKNIGAEKLEELDKQFKFSQSGNIEITLQWLLLAIQNKYAGADAKIEQTLMTVGRRKISKPIYEELAKSPEGKARATEIYRKARPGYHPILQSAVDKILATN